MTGEMVPSWYWCVQSVLVVTVAIGSYLHCCWAAFVFDDNEAILTNKDILTDTPLVSVFSNDFWGTSVLSNTSHKSYRPLTVITFRINYWMGGLDPWGYHLTNLVLHALVCLLFLRVCACVWEDMRLPNGRKTSAVSANNESWWSVLFAALLFSCHPVHTETVAGVVGRAELTSALCFFLALLVHRHTCSSAGSVTRQVLLLLLTTALAGVAMLFKEQGITIIGVCVVYDLVMMGLDPRQLLQLKYPGHTRREWRHSITRCSTLLVAGLLMTGLRMLTGAPTFQPSDNPASFHNSTLTRVLNYSYLYSLNSWLLLHPWWLCFDWSMDCVSLITSLYDVRLVAVATFWGVLLSLVLYCVFGKPSAIKRLTTIALALLVTPFLPASNLLLNVGFVLAERVLYLPSAGYCILVSMGTTVLSKHFGKKMCVLMSSLVVLVFMLQSMKRTTEWQSEELLFTSGIRVCPHNAKVLYNIGKVSVDSGDTVMAEAAYTEAIRLHSEYDQALNNYGNLLKDSGRYSEAEDTLRLAVAASPKFAAAWMNLGIVQAAQNKTQEAEVSYMTAIQHRRKYPDAYYNLGNMYIDTGRPDRAVAAFREAIRLQSDHRLSWGNLALLYENMELYEEAEKVLREAISVVPDHTHFYYSLGVVMGRVNRFKEGEELLLKALEMKPDSAKYHTNLGVIYHLQKDYFLAKHHYQRSLDLDPTMHTARDNLNKLMRTNHDQ